jgi:hypothetical protein
MSQAEQLPMTDGGVKVAGSRPSPRRHVMNQPFRKEILRYDQRKGALCMHAASGGDAFVITAYIFCSLSNMKKREA